MSCKCYNSYILWVYILHCFKQQKILLYNFRSITKSQHKLVPLRGRQQKALYVLSLTGSLGRINKNNSYFIPWLTKQRRKYSFPFPLLKATMFLPIREKLSDVKANTKPVWSSLTMVLIDSWNIFRYLLGKKLLAEKAAPALQLRWSKWPQERPSLILALQIFFWATSENIWVY